MVRKIETVGIKTKQGPAQYAKVVTRIREFVGTCKHGDIQTSVEFKDGWALFTARVRPDVTERPDRVFIGHALGKVNGGEKAFEKIETIAVGRALSFAGFLPTGEIASFEEIENFVANGGSVDNGEEGDRLDELEKQAKTKAEAPVTTSKKMTKRGLIDWCKKVSDDLDTAISSAEVDAIMAMHEETLDLYKVIDPQKLGVDAAGALTSLMDHVRMSHARFERPKLPI